MFLHRPITSKRWCKPTLLDTGILTTPILQSPHKHAYKNIYCFLQTNLLNNGLTSVDRSNKLLYHLQYHVPYSSRLLAISPLPRLFFCSTIRPASASRLAPYPCSRKGVAIRVASSLDSDLEAFSHYPSDGSVAPLAVQPRAKPIIRTNCSSRTRLDYYCNAAHQ